MVIEPENDTNVASFFLKVRQNIYSVNFSRLASILNSYYWCDVMFPYTSEKCDRYFKVMYAFLCSVSSFVCLLLVLARN